MVDDSGDEKSSEETKEVLNKIDYVSNITFIEKNNEAPSCFDMAINIVENEKFDDPPEEIENVIEETNFCVDEVKGDKIQLTHHEPVYRARAHQTPTDDQQNTTDGVRNDGGVTIESTTGSGMSPPNIRSETVEDGIDTDIDIVCGNTPSSLKDDSNKCVTSDIANYIELRYTSLCELVTEIKSCETEEEIKETGLGELYERATSRCANLGIVSAVVSVKQARNDDASVNGIYYTDSVEEDPVADLCLNIPVDTDMTVDEFDRLLTIAVKQHRQDIIAMIEGLESVVSDQP